MNEIEVISKIKREKLDEIVYKYNWVDSSSIRKEIMEDISNSNIYTISIYLKSFRNPDEAIKVIKEKGLKIAYQEGRKKIDKMLNVIRVMYIKVKQNKLNSAKHSKAPNLRQSGLCFCA